MWIRNKIIETNTVKLVYIKNLGSKEREHLKYWNWVLSKMWNWLFNFSIKYTFAFMSKENTVFKVIDAVAYKCHAVSMEHLITSSINILTLNFALQIWNWQWLVRITAMFSFYCLQHQSWLKQFPITNLNTIYWEIIKLWLMGIIRNEFHSLSDVLRY